jgi:hypothetical protein
MINSMPKWMLDSIHADLLRPEQPGFWRRASARRCAGCRAPTLAGLDDDLSTAEPATADVQPVSMLGEAWALGQGRVSYRLSGSTVRMMKLWRRDSFDIRHDLSGETDSLGVVRIVVSHRCGNPIPMAYHERKEI